MALKANKGEKNACTCCQQGTQQAFEAGGWGAGMQQGDEERLECFKRARLHLPLRSALAFIAHACLTISISLTFELGSFAGMLSSFAVPTASKTEQYEAWHEPQADTVCHLVSTSAGELDKRMQG